MDNSAVAERLDAFAALLDLAGSSYYTARAYRRAAELIRGLHTSVADLVRSGHVRELRGIGPGIEARLRELVETGRIEELDELENEVRPELVSFGRLLGLSPKRSVEIGEALGIRTAAEFREAIEAGRLQSVPGIGPKTEAKLRTGLAEAARPRPRRGLTLNRARALVEPIARELGGVAAGDPRRWADSSERLCIVTSDNDALENLAQMPQIVAVTETGVGITVEGVPVEVVIAAPGEFGAALLRATGADAYVEALEPLPDAATEEEVYARLGVPFCPPELREEAHRRAPPPLVEVEDIRGDLHCHTTWSDGRASVLEMAKGAIVRGYEYLAICDHTPSVGAVPGLTADDVLRQGAEIAAANEALAPFRVLRGIECDILRDGSLDLPDSVLAELDWVQASVHGGQRMPVREITARTLEAMRNPHVRCLSHPKGRIINHRPENALDLDQVFELAVETGVALEVNGLPDRLDLRGEHVRRAIEACVKIVASTDAHSVRGLANMELAVHTARRGWTTAADLLNTQPLDRILAM